MSVIGLPATDGGQRNGGQRPDQRRSGETTLSGWTAAVLLDVSDGSWMGRAARARNAASNEMTRLGETGG